MRYYRTNVFDSSRGLCRAAWRFVKWLYRLGAKGGLITAVYSLARRFSGASEGGGLLLYWLGRDIRKKLAGYDRLVIVAHPILAKILSGHHRVVYQHGELACPQEALVKRCRKMLVPWPPTAEVMRQGGIPPEQIAITGQGIEKGLVDLAEAAFNKRLERIKGQRPLLAALFSSGAYPPAHLRILKNSAGSLLESGYRVIFFAGTSPEMAVRLRSNFVRAGYDAGEETKKEARLRIILSENRRDENLKVASLFDTFDILIAPAHERTNWSVGLGLPQFMLCPHIGSYAPLNAAIARGRGVARDILNTKMAINLGETVNRLRADGNLAEMAVNGFNKTEIHGFERATEIVAEMTRLNR